MPEITEITPETIRLWAHDENLYFASQDEDLSLHRPEYIPVLIELAQVESPKQEFIKSILEYYIQWCFLYNKEQQLDEIHGHIIANKSSLGSQWLVLWSINFMYIYGISKKAQRLTDAACDKIAKDLTIGDYCKREFSFLGTLEDNTREYLASTDSFKLYFYILPITGQWKISKHQRLKLFGEA